jgi:phosphoribosyl 1,2-cyclic phosphate phosphodiesterase
MEGRRARGVGVNFRVRHGYYKDFGQGRGSQPPPQAIGVDLAVIPIGVVEIDPFTGSRRIPEDHPILSYEATFQETLGIAEKLDAGRLIMTHIEEPDGLTYDDLKRLEERDDLRRMNVTFAFDTLVVDV